jgi:hypothetical protein
LNASIAAPVLAAILAPIVTGTVTVLGIAIQRRWSDRDLEARRLKIIEAARNQIQAVEPLWNSTARAGTPDDTRDRAYTIIISALDSLLRAQALTESKEEEHHDRSILSDLLLFRHFHTKGARILRAFYYFSLVWLSFWIWVAVIVALDNTLDSAGKIFGALFSLSLGAAPVVVIRSWALRHERGHAPAAPSRDVRDTPPPPGPQYPVEGLPYSQPPYNQSWYREQPVHSKPPGEHQPPN